VGGRGLERGHAPGEEGRGDGDKVERGRVGGEAQQLLCWRDAEAPQRRRGDRVRLLLSAPAARLLTSTRPVSRQRSVSSVDSEPATKRRRSSRRGTAYGLVWKFSGSRSTSAMTEMVGCVRVGGSVCCQLARDRGAHLVQDPVAEGALVGGRVLPQLYFAVLACDDERAELGAVGGIARLALDGCGVARGGQGLGREGEGDDGGGGVVKEAHPVQGQRLCWCGHGLELAVWRCW
jgi:hypothetical protein